ncbi:unnamed protein product [Blepharisma stoltei]|uniref:Uncharacterized protein n=1 Tax=Blepharisma stoltei TaxID=1481888 RepID=A0AAU9IQY7_9CILI|nr:unnamed protein product [Blepharisma stoltei]
MRTIENDLLEKKEVLRSAVGEIKSYSILLKDDLEMDKQRVKKIAIAYEHSGGLLQRTNQALDQLLAQSETRVAIYVVGVCVMIFVVAWKFLF